MSQPMVPSGTGSSAPANNQGGRNPPNSKYPMSAHTSHGAGTQHIQPRPGPHQITQTPPLRQGANSYQFRVDLKANQQVPNQGGPTHNISMMSCVPSVPHNSLVSTMHMPQQNNARVQNVFIPNTITSRAPQQYTPGRLQPMIQQYQQPPAAMGYFPQFSGVAPYYSAQPMPAQNIAPGMLPPQQNIIPRTAPVREKKILIFVDPETNLQVDLEKKNTSTKPPGPPQPVTTEPPAGNLGASPAPMGSPQVTPAVTPVMPSQQSTVHMPHQQPLVVPSNIPQQPFISKAATPYLDPNVQIAPPSVPENFSPKPAPQVPAHVSQPPADLSRVERPSTSVTKPADVEGKELPICVAQTKIIQSKKSSPKTHHNKQPQTIKPAEQPAAQENLSGPKQDSKSPSPPPSEVSSSSPKGVPPVEEEKVLEASPPEQTVPVVQEDDDEERRKVEERNEENLRKSQQATQNTSRKEPIVCSEGSVAASKEDAPSRVPPSSKPDQVVKEAKSTRDVHSNAQTLQNEAEVVAPTPEPQISRNKTLKTPDDSPAPVEEMSKDEKLSANATLEEGEIVSDNEYSESGGDDATVNSVVPNIGGDDDYKPGQWSPMHPEGKKQYDRAFLLKLQYRPLSKTPPLHMDRNEIFREISNSHTLSDNPGQGRSSQFGDFRNGRNASGPMGGNRKAFPRPTDNRPPKKVIHLSSSMNQEVKLHTANNAWARQKESTDTNEQIYMKFRSILNKLTPQNFATLVSQVLAIEIDTEDRMSHITSLVMSKALNETHFASTYAKLCQEMLLEFSVPKVAPEDGTQTTVNFRKMLLQKCQQEFEKDTDDSAESRKREKRQAEERQEQLDAAENEKKRKEIQESFDDQDLKAKRRTLGLMRFIGELYNLSILNFHIMHDCFLKLLKNTTDEDSVECACNLFRTIGKKFADDAQNSTQQVAPDGPTMKDKYNELMQKLRKIIEENREAQKTNKEHLSQRFIFMLEDVWELKQRSWIPRRDEQAPKTLDEIKQDATNEKILAASTYSMGNSGGNGGGGSLRYNQMHQNDKSRTRNSYGSQPQANQRNNYGQVKDLVGIMNFSSINMSASAQNTTLGPSFPARQTWGTGASGGGSSRSSSLRGNRRPEHGDSLNINSVNKFAPLDGNENTRSQENSPSRRDAEHRRSASHAADKHAQSNNMTRGSAPSSRTPSQSGCSSGGETHSLQGQTNANNETIGCYAQSMLADFTEKGNREEFLQDFCERAHQQNVNRFIVHFIEKAVETPAQYHRAAEAITELHSKRIVSTRQIESALSEHLTYAEDLACDIPKYYINLADFVAKLVLNALSEIFDFRAILNCVCRGLGYPNAVKLLIPLFEALNKLSAEGVAKMWTESGLTIRGLLTGISNEDVERLEKALGTSGQASGSGLGLSLKELTARFVAVFKEPPKNRETHLANVIHQGGSDKQTEIRACTLAILMAGRHGDSFESEKLELTPTMLASLKKLFTRKDCIQALYALQTYMADQVYPKGVAVKFCIWVHDKELVDEDTFLHWNNTEANHEPIGYGSTLKSVESFVTWLKDEGGPLIEE